MKHVKLGGPALLRALVGLVVALPLAAQEREDGKGREALQRAYVAQRADASGQIPPGALYRAWQQVTGMPNAAGGALADASWRPLGPAGLFINQESFGGVYGGEMKAGRVNSIAFHPTNGQTIVLGSQGGVWRTTTGATTWTPLTDQQCTSSIGAVLIDPANPQIIYAATGDARSFVQAGCGVLRSIDGGNSWQPPQTTTLLDAFTYRLAIDKRTAGSVASTTVVAATSKGVYASVNSGAQWSQRIAGRATSVVADDSRPGVMFAAVVNGANNPRSTLYRSVDGGVTWNVLPTPLASGATLARMELAVSPAAPGMVFALAGDFQTREFIGVFRWDDARSQWTRLPATGVVTDQDAYPATFGAQAEYDLALAVDPRNPNRIWIAGVGAFLSEDGGVTFRHTAKQIHVDWHAIAFNPSDPDQMAAGTDGGIYLSYDGGRTWRGRNLGLAISQVYQGISVHPSGLWMYAGLQDNNAIYYSGSSVWSNLSLLGDGGYTVLSRNDPSTVWVTHSFNNFIMRQSRGVKEESRSNGINFQDRAGIPRPLAMDPVSSSTLYFGTHRLYRTTNEGLDWFPITTDLTRGSGFITALAVAPNDSRVIWAGTSDGVLAVSRDAGANWLALAFSTSRNFTRIVIDPADVNHVIATASTLNAPRATETRDGGQTFFAGIGLNLPNIPVHVGLQIPNSNIFMVGTDVGVLQSVNGGQTWTQGPIGLPLTIIHDLVYVQQTGTIYAATFGRGVFAYRPGVTPAVLRGDVDKDGRLSAQDALLIQQALVGLELPAGRSAFPEGDANCDGQLTAVDALLILRNVVGLPNVGVCVGTTQRVAPSPAMMKEDPASRRVLQGR
ncbi:MAG: dockerin type I domain-containing protein [Gemmatimonadaceae bacterium]